MRKTLRRVAQALTLVRGRLGRRWRAHRGLRRFPATADRLLVGFRSGEAPALADYANLVRYFMTGFAAFRSASGALADYPGPDSSNGPGMDRLEGFSRIAPLAAAWMHGGRDARLVLADGSALDLASMLRSGLLAGTDPASTDHWGRIEHWGLAIVEAGDIALALWLSRAQVWDRLNPDERHRIASWLLQVNDRRLPDNNWHLFVAKVNAVLASLGAPSNPAAMLEHYERAKTFYRGQGWFRDGVSAKTPGFDYYNAWAFHYELQWLRQIAPALDSDFIDAALRDFVAVYKHFIAPAGVPMLGRSTCYRMAAPTPLVFAQARHPDIVSPGQARRALDAVWTHFIGHGAVQQGNVTPGYFGSDLRLVEPYSGPASCLWSLRSLVAAFVFPDDHPLWISAPEPLPVELKDFHLAVGPTGWQVIGDRATGVVTLETGCDGDMPLQRSVTWDRWLSLFAAAPRRPSNVPAKYQRARFSSISPYNAADGVVPSRWGRR